MFALKARQSPYTKQKERPRYRRRFDPFPCVLKKLAIFNAGYKAKRYILFRMFLFQIVFGLIMTRNYAIFTIN